MFDQLRHIIRGEDYRINQFINIHNPTLREVCDFGESEYTALVGALTARPYDLMVQLDDAGINYMDVSDYQVFLDVFPSLSLEQSRILLGDLSPSSYQIAVHNETKRVVLINPETQSIIDEAIYIDMVNFVRKIHYIDEKIEFDAGNETTRKYLIKRARKKQKKNNGQVQSSVYSDMISALVNTPGCKYDYSSIFNLTISQFYNSFLRVNKLKALDNTLHGVYAGTISYNDLNKSDLNMASNI